MPATQNKKAIAPEKTPVFLLVVDVTEEFSVAVEYACAIVAKHSGRLALLNVIERSAFDHWLNVENKIKKEMRAQAESLIWDASRRVVELTGKIPMIAIEEGERSDIIIDMINQNSNIAMLILGGESSASNPGPLVSYFSGKGLSKLRVPLMIVPGHLHVSDLEAIL